MKIMNFIFVKWRRKIIEESKRDMSFSKELPFEKCRKWREEHINTIFLMLFFHYCFNLNIYLAPCQMFNDDDAGDGQVNVCPIYLVYLCVLLFFFGNNSSSRMEMDGREKEWWNKRIFVSMIIMDTCVVSVIIINWLNHCRWCVQVKLLRHLSYFLLSLAINNFFSTFFSTLCAVV